MEKGPGAAGSKKRSESASVLHPLSLILYPPYSLYTFSLGSTFSGAS
jgi:hypothetical protein